MSFVTTRFDNPTADAVNPSSKVLKFSKTDRWNDAVDVKNFENPISLFLHPEFRIKAASDSTTGKTIRVTLVDVNGYSVTMDKTMPGTVNTWADFTFDFSSTLKWLNL